MVELCLKHLEKMKNSNQKMSHSLSDIPLTRTMKRINSENLDIDFDSLLKTDPHKIENLLCLDLKPFRMLDYSRTIFFNAKYSNSVKIPLNVISIVFSYLTSKIF